MTHMPPLLSKKEKIKEKENKIKIKYRNFKYVMQYYLKVSLEEKLGLSSAFSNFFPIFQVFLLIISFIQYFYYVLFW